MSTTVRAQDVFNPGVIQTFSYQEYLDLNRQHLIIPGTAVISDGTDPVVTSHAPSTRVAPGLLEGMPLAMYGNSYGQQGIDAQTIYFDRVRTRLRSLTWNNLSVSSYMMVDICERAYGSSVAQSQGSAASAGILTTMAGTWTPSAFPGGAVILEPFRNDASSDGQTAYSGTTAKSRAGAANALEAWIRLVRAGSKIDDADPSITYGSSWAAYTGQNYLSNNQAHYTSTPADPLSVSLTVPASGEIDVVLMAIDSGVNPNGGAPFKVTCTGKADVTGTTNDQVRRTSVYPGTSGLGQMTVPFTGLTPGATVTVTAQKTGGASATSLFFDCILLASPTPPTIIITKPCHLPTAAYTIAAAAGNVGASTATDDIYGGIIDTVVAKFPADQSVTVIDPNAAGFDPSSMIAGYDNVYVHLNDTGNLFYADLIMTKLYALAPRLGLIRP